MVVMMIGFLSLQNQCSLLFNNTANQLKEATDSDLLFFAALSKEDSGLYWIQMNQVS